jgi:HAMP domain-containing protein/DNA-directed RNA polymerase subunit RPC12/RpoP
MIVICEECGKKYHVEMDKIKSNKASFRCVTCNHITVFIKPGAGNAEDIYSNIPPSTDSSAKADIDDVNDYVTVPIEKKESAPKSAKKIGIRAKMMMIILIIPMCMMSFTIVPSYNYIYKAINLIIYEATESEIDVAVNQINQSASTIARQIEFYLLNHPNITPEKARTDKKLKEILFQNAFMVDDAGLYLRFDPQKPKTFLISRDELLVGKMVSSIMAKGILGDAEYDEFGKVISAGPEGEHREVMGFFLAKDKNKNLKEKIMALAPVHRSPFGVIVTSETEDFLLPVKILEKRIRNLITNSRNIIAGVLGGTLVIIVCLIFYYVSRMTGKIKSLTDVANRISVGELEAQIKVRSNDEIGELADAVSRMQDSIRLSILRLRRRN